MGLACLVLTAFIWWASSGWAALLSLLLGMAQLQHVHRVQRRVMSLQKRQWQMEVDAEGINTAMTLCGYGLVLFNREGHVSYTSPLFQYLTGQNGTATLGLDEIEFSNWLSQKCPGGAPFSGTALLRLRQSGQTDPVRELIEISAPGKRLLEVEWCASSTGAVSQILLFRDVTNPSKSALERQQFISTAAHDLRSPMASLSGFAEVLQTQELDASTRQAFVKIIFEQSVLLSSLLNGVVALAKIDAQQGRDFVFTRTCVQTLLSDLVDTFTPPPGQEHPQMVMPDQALFVMADVKRLQQAIRNVLTNAYQYAPAGGPVTIEIPKSASTGPSGRCHLQITDAGVGMSPEQSARAFDRFYHVNTPGIAPGQGLGLSMAKKILQLHHGDIQISSAPGQGTRVSLSLPTVAPPSQDDFNRASTSASST